MLLEHFQGPLEVEYKSKERQRDPVSEADRRAEAFIKEEVARRFPSHGIVGEEGAGEGDEAAEFTWAVDPLDGTTNFVNGLPVFASSIALLERGVPAVAAVFVPWPIPEQGRVLHARRGGGSWEGEARLQVRDGEQPIPNGLIGVPRRFERMFHLGGELRRHPGELRVGGSTVYELAMVSCGVLQYSVHGSPYIWDVAAGVLLVQEAGGAVLTRSRGKRGWHPFEAFALAGNSATPGQKELRRWQAPILVASPQRVRLLGNGLRPRRYRLRRWIRRLRARFRRTPPAPPSAGTEQRGASSG